MEETKPEEAQPVQDTSELIKTLKEQEQRMDEKLKALDTKEIEVNARIRELKISGQATAGNAKPQLTPEEQQITDTIKAIGMTTGSKWAKGLP